MRTSNPVLKSSFYESFSYGNSKAMTIDGTLNKAFLLFFILLAGAGLTWTKAMNSWNVVSILPWLAVGLIGGLVSGLITSFNPKGARISAPIYAVFEGLLLGAISAIFEMRYPGIVLRAVFLTFGTMGAMLFLYKSGKIRVTHKFRLGVFAATGGIALFYLFSWILGLLGIGMPGVHGSGLLGIGFSVVVVGVAALNLVLDFDLIAQGSQRGLPQYMEWYSAFGLMVTLVWLYLEILRLLAKLSDRR
ncbi:MAG: Bax inhibitor-1/YccA family protein [Candidatus Marinimicrobia bacterium]|nr:Bax inhibitor-1/YccA family protein [Candidatus Neomarinimicrobiota bacterium]